MLKIFIDGEEITAKSPKAKIWREYEKFDNERMELLENLDSNVGMWLEAHAEIIAKVFNDDRITAESILDNVNIDDIVPLYKDCYWYLVGLISSKLKKLPNAPTPTE